MPQAPRGRGDLEAGDGFLRRGDPVNLYPFIEAEKAGRRNVKRACALLKVSRAAFCQHLSGPSRRDQEDADGYTVPSRPADATTGTSARSSGLPARSTRTIRSMRDGSSCAQVMAMAAALDWPMTANDGAPTASAMASTSPAWLRQP